MNQLRDLIVKSFVMERVGHQVARVISHLRRTVIMVNGEIVQVRARDAKNGAVPVQVIVTDSNQADGGIDSAHRCSVAVEIPRVGLCVAVSAHPGSPNLVAEFPVFHPEWFGVAVGRAHGAVFGIGRTIGVFHPCRGLVGCGSAPFHVHCERRLRAQVAAELNEFVGAKVAGFILVGPGEIHPRGALIARTYSPHPVIILSHIAAWPANERGVQRLNLLKHIGAHTVHSVSREQ